MGRPTKEEQKRRAELLAKGIKVCNKCGRELPVEQFSKDKTNKDGLKRKCKECDKISSNQYIQEHKEERLQYNKQYSKQYYQEHKKEKQQYDKQHGKQYRQEHKEERRQYDKQYKQTPQGQIVAFNASTKRRKREELQGAGINKEQWLEMMQFFDFKCAYSGIYIGGEENKGNRSIDHIIPLAKDGEHKVWNCVPMDRSLNSSKQEKDIMEWYTAQEFYSKEKLDKILEWQQYAYNKWSNTEEAQ